MKKAMLSCSAFLLLYALPVFAADATVVSSPDGKISFKLFLKDQNLHFSVTREKIHVIENSPVVLLAGDDTVTANVTIGKITRSKFNEAYPWSGAHDTALNQYNEAVIAVVGVPRNYKSQTTNHKLQITNYKSQITNHKLQITNYKSQTTNHKLQITNYKSQITNYKLLRAFAAKQKLL